MSQRTSLIAAVAFVALAAGFVLGRVTHSSPPSSTTAAQSPAGPGSEAESAAQVYTCSMHPQVRLDRPGKCPICEMPLIPATTLNAAPGERPTLELSEHALAMANVETSPVERRELARELRAVGKIQYNESSLATVTARVDGYAERLFVNFTGIEIKAGDHLAEVYSPELIVAQQELLIALQSGEGESVKPLVETAKLKLKRWGLTEEQIAKLVAERTITDRVTLYSPIQGTVIEKSILENSAFRAGDALYRVANLDTVWIYLDIYEYDLAWVRYGQVVDVVAEALPGRRFEGRVTFVQPLVDEETRTVRVPVHVENPEHVLKPGMFVSAVIRSALTADGKAAPTGVEGRFTCPMHPQVLLEEAGPCPICGMRLERIPGAPSEAHDHAADAPPAEPAAPLFACPMKCEGDRTYAEPGNCPVCEMKLAPVEPANAVSTKGVLAVPAGAVLDSGLRKLVYVERSKGLFEPREVVTGPRVGDFVPVLSGLSEGERVVTRGGFLIDSQFQVTGHPSLFYPGGLMAGAGAHEHGTQAPASESDTTPPTTQTPPPAAGAQQHQH